MEESIARMRSTHGCSASSRSFREAFTQSVKVSRRGVSAVLCRAATTPAKRKLRRSILGPVNMWTSQGPNFTSYGGTRGVSLDRVDGGEMPHYLHWGPDLVPPRAQPLRPHPPPAQGPLTLSAV